MRDFLEGVGFTVQIIIGLTIIVTWWEARAARRAADEVKRVAASIAAAVLKSDQKQ